MFKKNGNYLSILLILGVVLSLHGCGGGGGGGGPSAPAEPSAPQVTAPQISEFTATPSSLSNDGGDVQLAWKASNVKEFSLSGAPSLDPTFKGQFYSRSLTIPANTGLTDKTYTITLTASNGSQSVTKDVVITVAKSEDQKVLSLVAGQSGGQGHADDIGLDARFESSAHLTQDSNGNVFISEPHGIRKMTSDGKVTSLTSYLKVSGGTDTLDGTLDKATFDGLGAIVVDKANNIYVAQSSYFFRGIRKISPSGVVTTLAGKVDARDDVDGIGTAAHFSLITDMSIDAEGNLYVLQMSHPRYAVRKITPSGSVTTLTDKLNIDPNGYNLGSSLTVDQKGNAYILNAVGSTILKVTSSGEVSTFATNLSTVLDKDFPSSFYQSAITSDAHGNIYFADNNTSSIRKITPNGVVSTVVESNKAIVKGYSPKVVSMSLDSLGNILLFNNACIRKVDTKGNITILAGREVHWNYIDGLGSVAQFYMPKEIDFSPTGDLYVSDSNSLIRKISAKGEVTTVARLAQDHVISSIGVGAVDRFGNLFIVDAITRIISKLSQTGNLFPFVGNSNLDSRNMGIAKDGVGLNASFIQLGPMTIDSYDNLYVIDNNAIRKVTPEGVVSTLVSKVVGDEYVSQPTNIVFDRKKQVLYTIDALSIRQITLKGEVSIIFRTKDLIGTYLAIDDSGNFYVGQNGDAYAGKGTTVSKFTPEGKRLIIVGQSDYALGVKLGKPSRLNRISSLAIKDNKLYISDSEENVVLSVDL